MSKPVLSYFPGRGRAEVIRLTLAEAKVDYVDNRVPDIAELKNLVNSLLNKYLSMKMEV